MVEKTCCARFESASVSLNQTSQAMSLQNGQHFLLLLIYFFASCATNETERDKTLMWVIYQSKSCNKAVENPGFPTVMAPTPEEGTPIYFGLRGCARPWGPLGSATDSSLLPPATKLGQGNVFTGVCDSAPGGSGQGGASAQGGVSAPRGVCSVWGVPLVETPPGRPLLRAVRILLECILVNRGIVTVLVVGWPWNILVADLRGPKFFQFHAVWENLAKSYVGALFPSGELAPPPRRKSWISHCILLAINTVYN